MDENNPYYNTIILYFTITQNKGESNIDYLLSGNTILDITESIENIFDDIVSMDKDIFLSSSMGGYFDREYDSTRIVEGPSYEMNTEYGGGATGSRVHWHVTLKFSYIGRLQKYSRINRNTIIKKIYLGFYEYGHITNEQYNNYLSYEYKIHNGNERLNIGIHVDLKINTIKGINYSKYKDRIMGMFSPDQISRMKFDNKGKIRFKYNDLNGNIKKYVEGYDGDINDIISKIKNIEI